MSEKETLKRVLVPISAFTISCLCRPTTIEIFSPIPHDAKYIGIHYDPTRDCFLVCFEHESFMSIPLGVELPVIESIRCEHIIKEEE